MLTMTMDHYQQTDTFSNTLDYLNMIFICIFTSECLMKVFALRYHYFVEPWNLFDFVVVILSILGKVQHIQPLHYQLRSSRPPDMSHAISVLYNSILRKSIGPKDRTTHLHACHPLVQFILARLIQKSRNPPPLPLRAIDIIEYNVCKKVEPPCIDVEKSSCTVSDLEDRLRIVGNMTWRRV